MRLSVMATVGVDVVTGTGTAVGVGLGVIVGVAVGTDVGVGVGVTVAVAVGVTVGVPVGTAVGVGAGVGVGEGVGVAVGVAVGVGVGCPAMRVATAASTVAFRSGVVLPAGTTQPASSVASPMSSSVASRAMTPPVFILPTWDTTWLAAPVTQFNEKSAETNTTVSCGQTATLSAPTGDARNER